MLIYHQFQGAKPPSPLNRGFDPGLLGAKIPDPIYTRTSAFAMGKGGEGEGMILISIPTRLFPQFLDSRLLHLCNWSALPGTVLHCYHVT